MHELLRRENRELLIELSSNTRRVEKRRHDRDMSHRHTKVGPT